MQFSRPVTVIGCKNKSQHTATIIWMHGLGDTAAGWTSAMQAMTKSFPYIKFLLPTAPLIKVTIQGGAKCTAWHDIENFQDLINNKFQYKEDSKLLIEQLINKELQSGIPLNRIMLGGFSQGAAMALYTALLYTHPNTNTNKNTNKNKNESSVDNQSLAGIISLSGYLCDKNIPFSISPYVKQSINILMCHGSNDMIVNTKYGRLSYATLKKVGCKNIEWEEFDIGMELNYGHNVVPNEMKKVALFVAQCLPMKYISENVSGNNNNINVNTDGSGSDQKENKNSNRGGLNVGGMKNREIDEIVINACKAVRNLAQALTSNGFLCFDAIQCKSQVVQGLNLFVKVKVGESRFIHVCVWCKLDNTYVLRAVEFDKSLEENIVYMRSQASLVGNEANQ